MLQTAITWNEIQIEAERRGYLLKVEGKVDDSTLYVAKMKAAHVNRRFREHPGFRLAPERDDEYSLLQAYYWIRGYYLDYGDDGKMTLHRGMHHPLYDQQIRVAETWDYIWDGGLRGVHQKMLQWVAQVEQES